MAPWGTSRLSYLAPVYPGAKLEVSLGRFPTPSLSVRSRSEGNAWLIATNSLTLGPMCLLGQCSLMVRNPGCGLDEVGFNAQLCWL